MKKNKEKMKEIKTEFDAALNYGFDKVTGLVGLLIESGGGNNRNPDHTILFRDILSKLKKNNSHNVSIYIAASKTKANNYPDNNYRMIKFENQTEFNFRNIDLAKFMSNANDEIREKGKVDPNSLNGSIHKKILITSDLNENDWNELFGNISTNQIVVQELINNQNEEDLEYTYQKIKKRLGQSKFRKELLKAYNNTCAVTECEVLDILEAAHIQPYNGAHTSIVTNGILLRSDIHDLFDLYKDEKRLITISADFKIEVHSSLIESEYWKYNGKEIQLPKNESDYPEF
ncbi:HNH endonuclease [Lacinutrix sp. MEBiC02404]